MSNLKSMKELKELEEGVVTSVNTCYGELSHGCSSEEIGSSLSQQRADGVDQSKNVEVGHEGEEPNQEEVKEVHMEAKKEEDVTEDEEQLDDPDLFPEGGTRAYLTLLGAFIGFIGSLGFVNSSGVLASYLSSTTLADQTTSNIGWIFSIYNFLTFGLALVVGPIFDRVGCKIPLIIGIILQTAGFMCLSVSQELYQAILSYSVLGGIGSSLTFTPFLGVCSHHFLKKRAQAIGGAYIGGAIGGTIFPLVFRSLFKKLGWGWGIRIGSFMVFACLVIGALLVSDRRRELLDHEIKKKSLQEGISEEELWKEAESDGASQVVKQILSSIDFSVFKDKVYTCLVFSLLGNGFSFLISLTYIPSYAVANGASESDSFLLMVAFNCMSIPGRLIPSIMADKYGRFNTLCVINLLNTIAFFVIWVPPPIGHKLVGIYVFACFYGFTSGSVLSLSPACIGQICKTRDFGKRYGTAYFALSFGDLIGIPIGGAIVGASSSSITGYDNLVIFIAVLSLCGTIASFLARILYKGFEISIV